MGSHARKSASGTKRWLNCPGSLRESEGRPNESSGAAQEGTAAHGLGEYCLTRGIDAEEVLGGVVYLDENEDAVVVPPDPDAEEQAVAQHREAAGGPRFPVDADMADAVQVYLNAVRDEAERLGKDAELSVERRFDLSWLRPEMFGTNDASVFLLFDHMTVFDYKHGRGVGVEVEDEATERLVELMFLAGQPMGSIRGNLQLLYYGLGMANDVDWAFETMDLVVVQPRKAHSDGLVRRYSTTKAELRAFQQVLAIAADDADKPDAELRAGEWCQFCPAAGRPCRELEAEAYRTAAIDFADDGEISSLEVVGEWTDEERLGMAMRAKPILDSFIKAVETEALRRLRETPDGVGFGHKLVRKKSNRKWAAEDDQVAEKLAELGFPRDDLYERPKFKGPAKVEKLRPPELVARLKAEGIKAPAKHIEQGIIGPMAYKPEGGITVAPIDDPREAVPPSAAAASDFEAYEGED